MTGGDAKSPDKKAKADARAARLEQALKTNLRRRKTQAKARSSKDADDSKIGAKNDEA